MSPLKKIDIHVGKRLKLCRTMNNLSQEKLGKELGVTFQQVQKYEKGENRIPASRLLRLSEILGIPISYFFDGIELSENHDEQNYEVILNTDFIERDSINLFIAFNKIENPNVRRKVIDLIVSLVDTNFENK